MRSEWAAPAVDCEDALVKSACLLDAESCPAACKTTDEPKDEEPTVVKAGDLAVSATPAAGRKINLSGISDLDTLTFRSSEEVTLTKVILERYGYSSNSDVSNVWLEDENGNMITEKKQLDSKGQAKLTIKKDYRKVDGTYNATIVVEAKGTGGNTMWFKVVDVESTAKNLNVSNYNPYTYEMVSYAGVNVTFVVRGTTKDYNYVAGEAYEVSKFKVKAPADSAILVRGFTLTNNAATKVDVERYLDKLTLTVDGKTVKASHKTEKGKDKITVSFNDVEIAAKQSSEFVVSMQFSEDFEDYSKSIQYSIASESDFSAVDAKTESRVKPDLSSLSWPVYNFLGGKVKLSNTKVGNVDAAYGSVDVKVAEGSISTTEALRGTFTIYAKDAYYKSGNDAYTAIESMKVTIAGEEYEVSAPKTIPTHSSITGTPSKWDLARDSAWVVIYNGSTWDRIDGVPYTFNVDIEKSGKVEVRVDVRDMPEFNGYRIKFTNLSSDAFSTLEYEDVRNQSAKNQIAGFVTIYDVTVQPAKAAFKNNLTKAVEFIQNETTNKVVFDGVYTAKNGTVNLTDWTVAGTKPAAGKVTFYLSIDGDEVDDIRLTANSVTGTFANLKVNEGEEVKVVVTAEVDWVGTGDLGTFSISLAGEDSNGNSAGSARANTVSLKVVEKATVTVSSDAAAKATVLRKVAGAEIAQFTVKPSNGASEVDLESIVFILSGSTALSGFDDYDVTVTVWDTTEDVKVKTGANFLTGTVNPNITVPSNGLVVKVFAEKELTGTIELTGLVLNEKDTNRSFSKRFEDVVVRIVAQKDMGGATQFTVEVDWDSDLTVKDLKIATWATATAGNISAIDGVFGDGDTFEIAGDRDAAQMITAITYTIDGRTSAINIAKKDFNDFFKVGDTYARVFKA